jgi:phosphoglycolate phosphatase
MTGPGLLIFDLDGTLVDSKNDLVKSVNAMRAWAGLGPLEAGVIASYVGDGAPALVRRALPDASDERLAAALRYFYEYYREHMLDETVLYPGVREGLDRLHEAGAAMAVLTNKPVRFSVSMIENLGLDAHFFRIYGGNSFPHKKPHPAGVIALMAEARAAPADTLVVGDSAVDVLTARNAGVQACGVTWGFQPESFAQAPPDFMISDLRQLTAPGARAPGGRLVPPSGDRRRSLQSSAREGRGETR